MSLFAPYMLWGALAAGIPVAIHFFFRSRYRTVPWGAMKFLLQSIQETSRRRKFQELLLLLLRIATLLLLAFALARPSSRAGGGSGDAVDAVLLLDVSYSMDAKEENTTRLDRAKSAARSVLDRLPSHSTVQIVTVADRAESLGPANAGEIEQARSIVSDINVSQLASDLRPGLQEAIAALERGTSPNKELYIFGDMQKLGWEQQPGPVVEAFRKAQSIAAVTLVRCGSKSARNVSIAGIVPQTGLPRVGERVGLTVLVKNAGTEAVRDLTVTLTLDGDESTRESQPIAVVPGGESRSATLSARWEKPGLHTVTATVEPDDLAADNRFDLVLPVRDQVRVLVVDGAISEREPEKSSSYFLLHALVPVKESDAAKYYLQPRLVPPSRASAAHLTDKELCILVNCPAESDPVRRIDGLAPEFREALERFVRGGKPLLMIAGNQVVPESYNRILSGLTPLKLERVKSLPDKSEVTIDRSSIREPAFWKFRDDDAYRSLANVRTTRYIELAEHSPDGKGSGPVLVRFSDGKPLLAARQVGAGQVMMLTTSADTSWTDWPLWLGTWVPFVDVMLNRLLLSASQEHNGTAGEPIRWYVPDADAARNWLLRRPDGRKVRLGLPEPVNGRPMLTATDTPQSGVYKIAPADDADNPRVPFALRADPREGLNLETLTDAEIDDKLGFKPAHVSADELGADAGIAERLRREWTPWLLLVLLIAAGCESLLAWQCGRAG